MHQNPEFSRERRRYRGVAIAYVDSVVRLFIDQNKIVVAKGSDAVNWLQVFKLGGQTDAYRVFSLVDPDNYVDVSLGTWVENYAYLNINIVVDAYFRDPSVTGLMGNWNDDPSDDIRNNTELALRHGFPLDDSLLTCTECSKYLGPAGDDEPDFLKETQDNPLTKQGMTAVPVKSIPTLTFTPKLQSVPYNPPPPPAPKPAAATLVAQRNLEENLDPLLFAGAAMEFCDKVINDVPYCAHYVPNRAFFVYDVCIKDAVTLTDFKVVENTKIAYLRECRRALDSLLGDPTISDEDRAIYELHRTELGFGDTGWCPSDCPNKGDCLAAGCKCHDGFTGYICDLDYPVTGD
ncbi:TPA: hypothetical protein N0F65_009135 [Lagenidium giganteum]|uniref:VWFD domain-containing protein n=1 Tax=Lagenidium giganteum TaxID=4803 RepID=A0AAV2YHU3_9STRA|nr:TPA: hypothetical protein N0F65_009135 [Lagenidium giganteum]